MVKKINLLAIPLVLIFNWIRIGVSAIDLILIFAYIGILLVHFRERKTTVNIELNDLEDIKTFLNLMNKGQTQISYKYFASFIATDRKSKPLYCDVHPVVTSCDNCSCFAQSEDV